LRLTLKQHLHELLSIEGEEVHFHEDGAGGAAVAPLPLHGLGGEAGVEAALQPRKERPVPRIAHHRPPLHCRHTRFYTSNNCGLKKYWSRKKYHKNLNYYWIELEHRLERKN